jgi:hypothetical protein
MLRAKTGAISIEAPTLGRSIEAATADSAFPMKAVLNTQAAMVISAAVRRTYATTIQVARLVGVSRQPCSNPVGDPFIKKCQRSTSRSRKLTVTEICRQPVALGKQPSATAKLQSRRLRSTTVENPLSSSPGATVNPRASFKTTVKLGTLSPRSTCPTYVAVSSAASARSSWVQPRPVRSWRTLWPKISPSRVLATLDK